MVKDFNVVSRENYFKMATSVSGMWRREKSGRVQEKFFQKLTVYSENF